MNFLQQEFPSIGETSRDMDFFEEEDELAPVQKGVDPLVSGSSESNSKNGDSLHDHEPSSNARDPLMIETQNPRSKPTW